MKDPLPSPPVPRPILVHAGLIAVSVLFGINFVGMKTILDEVPALDWALVRVGLATAVLLPLTPRLAPGARLPGRRMLGLLLPVAILGVGGNQVLFALGLERTTPAHSSLIVACIPVLTLAFAALAGQERVTGAKLLSVGCALAGVLVLLRVDRMVSGSAPADDEVGVTLVGDLLTVANVTGYSAFLILMRRVGRNVPAAMSTAVCFVWSTLFIAACALPGLDPEGLAALLGPRLLGWALFSILGATAATYLINVWALRHAPGSVVALYVSLQPIVATGLSMALGQDAPGLRFGLAAALVFAGLAASVRATRAG